MTLQQPARDPREPGAPTATPEFEVVAGTPTPAELAAVTAVIASMIEQLEDDQPTAAPIVSCWQRSQRSIRVPLKPGAGAWRSFSG